MSHTNTHQKINLGPVLSAIQKSGSIVLVIAIALGGYFIAHYLLPGSGHIESEVAQPSQTLARRFENLVVMSGEKLQAAKLTTCKIEVQEFQPHKKVPGTISYNAAKKVDLRASVEAVVAKVIVEPRQQVKAGDQLLVLTGPEVGRARIAIEQAKANLKLSQTECDWARETNDNLQELLALLNQRPTVEQVNTAFTDRMLGEHRDEILTAYSQYLLARKSVDRGANVDIRGVIPGRVLDERRSNLEVADAKYRGIIEQSKFQSVQDFTRAKAKLAAAESELGVCEENLSTLVGPFSDVAQESADEQRKNLSRFVLTAPRDGHVVELIASESSRFAAGEVMLVIAETSDVWVEAQIPQREMQSLKLTTGQRVSVTVPGSDEETYMATIRYFSSTVSSTTLAVPLVMELQNKDQTFRPGMFVWVSIPTAEKTSTITVPIGAIQRDGNHTFVFLSEGPSEFRRVDVEIGLESEGQIEIKSGLKVGDVVVDGGAFFLKSELLLETE